MPAEGFEPPTYGLQNRCTTTVLSRHACILPLSRAAYIAAVCACGDLRRFLCSSALGEIRAHYADVARQWHIGASTRELARQAVGGCALRSRRHIARYRRRHRARAESCNRGVRLAA